MNKSIVLSLLGGVSLLSSCQKNDLSDIETTKASQHQPLQTVVFEASVATPKLVSLEDEGLRAIGWKTVNDITSPVLEGFEESLSGHNATRAIRISIRQTTNDYLTSGNAGQFNILRDEEGKPYLRIIYKGTAKHNDTDNFYPVDPDNSYGAVCMNGVPGDEKPWNVQFFSYFSDKKVADTAPNKIVKQVAEGDIDYRNFPYMSEYKKINVSTDTEDPDIQPKLPHTPTKSGDWAGNYGNIKTTLVPRGSLMRIKLSNQTGQDIIVTAIEADSTDQAALAYEGYFNLDNDRFGKEGDNLPTASIADGTETKLRFTESHYGAFNWKSTTRNPHRPTRPAGTYHNLFPLYQSDGTTAGVTISSGETIGRFNVWGYPIKVNATPFRFRVKYKVVGSQDEVNSRIISVEAPSTGFGDGVAYNVTGVINSL